MNLYKHPLIIAPIKARILSAICHLKQNGSLPRRKASFECDPFISGAGGIVGFSLIPIHMEAKLIEGHAHFYFQFALKCDWFG